MKTRHRIHFEDSRAMSRLADGSAHMVVTSPPYPMIEMWDEAFCRMNPEIGERLKAGDGRGAFRLMHDELDKVWEEVHRVLVDGGIACINIGDAVRTIGGAFQLYCSHARILLKCLNCGFQALPAVIWRKQTNAPNKFMGSGMLPPGAYVTLEHEFVLILRKGAKREFITGADRSARRESAYFWEERNAWFSDVWFDLKGTRQKTGGGAGRERSGAFPFELPYRLINMFSLAGETVLDPFAGTGVAAAAAIAARRDSVGFEIDGSLRAVIEERLTGAAEEANERIERRIDDHRRFVAAREKDGKTPGKRNVPLNAPCVSAQETDLRLLRVSKVERTGEMEWEAAYEKAVGPEGFPPERERTEGPRRRPGGAGLSRKRRPPASEMTFDWD